MDEIKEEKRIVNQITMNIIKVREQVKKIIQNGKVDEFVKRSEYNSLVESYNILVNQYNEMISNFVKKEKHWNKLI